MAGNDSRGLFALALAVVFALKLTVLFSLGQHPLLVPAGDLDGAYYAHLAERVAGGDVWLLQSDSFFGQPAPAFFISPLYIYVLAFFLKVGGSIDAARFAQVLLGAFAVGLLAMTARRWYGAAAGWWTGAFAAGFGLFTFYEILILPASLDPFLTALDVYLLTRAVQADQGAPAGRGMAGVWWWAAAGAALGLHALNRPNMLIVLAGLAVLLIVHGIVRRALRTLKGLPAFFLAAVIVIAPATLRNYRATGQFVPIASNGGLNFLIGNGPGADGTFVAVMNIDPSVRGQWLDAPQVAKAALGKDAVTAPEVSKFFRDRAFGWIRDHPGAELALLGRKTWYALSAGFLTLNHSYPFFARDLGGPLAWLVVGPALIVPLGLVGLVVARPRREGYWLWAAFVPLAIASVVVFFVAARYRLPVQAALCVAAGGAAEWAWDRVHARAWRPLVVAAAATLAVAVVALWPTRLNDGRGEEQARMGLQEIQSDRVAEGEQWIAQAVTRHPFPGVVHLRAGQMYELRSQPGPALVHYRKAIAIDPTQTSVRFVLGRTLYLEKRFEDAIAELKLAQTGRQADAATRLIVLALSRLDRRDEANAAVRQLDPARWDAETAREFALGLTDVGRIDLSTVAWRRAAEAGNDAKDYERLGLAWAVLGNHPQAIAAFSHAVERDPASATIRLNYAVAFATVGRLADARREAETALKLNPGYERAREFLRSISK